MKLVESPTYVKKSEDFKEMSFGISQKNFPILLEMLRSKLYSNKMLAIIREYSTNAWDAQEDKSIPISIKVPSSLDPVFEVRDFGMGLTQEEIEKVYVQYGESTKRESNDNIGGFGIGCKSAFCYSDNFLITSIVKCLEGNIEEIYSAYIDETKIGKVIKISSKLTSDTPGIKISIPIKLEDIPRFNEEVRKFFEIWEIMPSFLNFKVEKVEQKQIASGKDWKLLTQRGSSVIIGNVSYPLNMQQLNNNTLPSIVYNFFVNSNLLLYTPIGAIEIALNREGLEYSKKTIKVLNDKLIEIYKDILDKFQEEINNKSSLIDAKILFEILNSKYYYLKQDLAKITYKNQKLNSCIFNINDEVNVVIYYVYNSRVRSSKIENKFNIDSLPWRISANKSNFSIYISDTSCSIKRIKEIIKAENPIVLISPQKDKTLDKFLEENKLALEGYKLHYTSEIELVKQPGVVRNKNNNIDTKKYNFKSFKYNYNANHTVKSDYFESCDLPATGGIYVVINRFFWINNFAPQHLHPSVIEENINNLKTLHFPIDEVYAIREENVEDLDENWISLEEYINKTIIKHVKDIDYFNLKRNFDISFALLTNKTLLKDIKDKTLINRIKDPNSLFINNIKKLYNYIEEYNKMDPKLINIIVGYIASSDYFKDRDVVKELEAKKLISELYKQYPLLSHLNYFSRHYWEDNLSLNEDTIDYINLIDKHK